LPKKQIPKDKQTQARPRTTKVSWTVFLATLVVVLISLTTVLFPSLVVRSTSQFEDAMINPYEVGVWTYPLLVTNLILLGISILYKIDKLPQTIKKSIRFIFGFEVSTKIAFIVMIIFLVIYASFTVSEISQEEIWSDYKLVKETVQYWAFDDVIRSPFEPNLRYLFLSISLNAFGNIRIVPFIISIALVILTYFITKQLSQKRFAGLAAVAIVLQSSVFLSYDTSAAYDNLWTFLYVLSLYFIYKKWSLSPPSFIASVSAKALTTMFLPITLFFIYRSNLSRQKKKILLVVYGAIIIAGIAVATSGINIGSSAGSDTNDFCRGFTAWAFQMRFDGIILIFILPLIVGLFMMSRRGIIHTDSIMILIMGMLLSAPILQGFTDQTVQPYRFVPLVVFFAIGIGTMLSKTNEQA
jgi:hypothetical protein